jgi:predicted Rossmann-fold nucleotide-binding protein
LGNFKNYGRFVNGYEAMGRIGPCVSIGSARTKPEDPYYTCRKNSVISKAGYGVITGGGLALWKRVTKAHLGGGTSVGLNIVLPFEQHFNPLTKIKT